MAKSCRHHLWTAPYVKFRRILEIPLLAMLVRYSAGGPFCCYFFGWEDYMPELQEIGLDPAVQGVPVKKKLSVVGVN